MSARNRRAQAPPADEISAPVTTFALILKFNSFPPGGGLPTSRQADRTRAIPMPDEYHCNLVLATRAQVKDLCPARNKEAYSAFRAKVRGSPDPPFLPSGTPRRVK